MGRETKAVYKTEHKPYGDGLKSRFDPKGAIVYVGIVKDNRDPSGKGIIRVWIEGSTSSYEEDNEQNWVPVRYASPFAGQSYLESSNTKQLFNQSEKSYGMWIPSPEIGSRVIVSFIAGDVSQGIYFAALYNERTNNMVPGIPATTSTVNMQSGVSSTNILPTVEFNRQSTDPIGTGVIPPRGPHLPLSNGLIQQGLINDTVRGISSSGSRRESPSRVFGFLTPRGHQIVVDDGWKFEDANKNRFTSRQAGQEYVDPLSSSNKGDRIDEGIRLRTRSGTQILLNEEHGMIYLISRDGETWIELNQDGHIDVYAGKSISFHALEDFNVKAKNIQLEAENNISIKTISGNLFVHTGSNIEITSDATTNLKANILNLNITGDYHSSAGTAKLHVDGEYTLFANPINSNNVDPGAAPIAALPDTYNLTQDNFDTQNNSPRTGISIVPRVPEHEPWNVHKITNASNVPLTVDNASNIFPVKKKR